MGLRLGLMMFLQFFLWGSWFVTLGSFLSANFGATDSQSAMAFSTQSWGAIVSPFLIGLIADRYFHAERLLGIIHLIGAGLMYQLGNSGSFSVFYAYLLGYMILCVPTLTLVNTIAFRHLRDPSRQFPQIRIFGTAGWILAGLSISYVFSWDSAAGMRAGMLRNTFSMCAGTSVVLGLYSFTLPATFPPINGKENVFMRGTLGFDAFHLFKDRNFLVFFAASMLLCIPAALYYQYVNQFLAEIHVANATGVQTLAQTSEILAMLLIPVALMRLGMKRMFLLSMLAWAIRYALFTYGNSAYAVWMLLMGVALHGVCFDFFFVSGQIYTNTKAGVGCGGAAQGLVTFATYGVGMLVGFWAGGRIADYFNGPGGHNWGLIWGGAVMFSLAVFAMFAMLFRDVEPEYRGSK